jgi:hypothetical protein
MKKQKIKLGNDDKEGGVVDIITFPDGLNEKLLQPSS